MRTFIVCLLLILNLTNPFSASAGGLLGDIVKGAGKATGIKPIEKIGQELDNVHRDIKNAIPPYKQIEESGSDFVRHRFLDLCNANYQIITNAVIVQCSNWDGRMDGTDVIQDAIESLISAGLFSPDEFSGVQIRWCPLLRGSGMAPDRGKIYLDLDARDDNLNNIAALLAHEMIHIRQYRHMGSDEFKCEYSRMFIECGGCQDERHPMEREAYQFENLARDKLNNRGWQICNESDEGTVWVAYAYMSKGSWLSEGWRRIDHGECSTLIQQIDSRYVYYYAQGSEGGEWSGDNSTCVHPENKFSIRGDMPECPSPYVAKKFKRIDTGDSRSWKTRLNE